MYVYVCIFIRGLFSCTMKEARDKFKGWVNVSTPHGIDLAYKKVGDDHPLRLWKATVEVTAPPNEVLNRILQER